MEKIKYSIWALAMLTVGFSACTKNDVPGADEQQIVEPDFTFSTRADMNGDPELGDAFTLMAYHMGAATELQQNQLLSNYGQTYGYYAYTGTGLGAAGDFIPTAITSNYTATTPLTKNRTYAMKLPANTSATSLIGVYRIAMTYPAIPIRNSGVLGLLAVSNLNDDIYASSPDDINGDGTNVPFEISVTSNQMVHDIPPGVRLYPVRAAIRTYFYSTEGATIDSISEIQLINAGSNGWFNARTGVTYPNYNYTSTWKNVYSSSLAVDNAGDNYTDVSGNINQSAASVPLLGGGTAQAQWLLDDQRVFVADYRGADAGGNSYIVPMTLSVKLNINGASAINQASIPISLNILRGKRYTFYVNVTSLGVIVTYSVSAWESGGDSTNDIGGEVSVYDYATVLFTSDPGNWESGGDWSNQIGS